MKNTSAWFILLGGISLVVVFIPGGADPYRKLIMNMFLIPGGLVFIGHGIWPKTALTLREHLGIFGFAALGFLLSLFVNFQFPGGDFLHSYRGFPYRWLVGTVEFGSREGMRWYLFTPGLLADGLFWLNVGILLVMALHFLMPKIQTPHAE
jgi:hypothetical protein